MQIQRGVAVRYFAGAAISDAIDSNGVGKAVIHGTDAEEVIEGTEAGYYKFAGVVKAVEAGATDAAEGDAVSVDNDKIVDVLMAGAVSYGDFITTAADGKFQKLTLSATVTAEEVLKICGRVVGAGLGQAGTTKALIWVRK
jgi:hypothetical protein